MQPLPASEAEAEVDPGYVLWVADFRREFENLTANKADAWTNSSPGQALNAVEFLEAILIEHGVKHSGEIEQRHLAAVRNLFNEIDPNWGRSRRGPKTVLDLETMRKRGERVEQSGGKKGLSTLTVGKHLTNLNTFLTHIRASGYELSEKLSTSGPLRPKKPTQAAAKRKTVKPPAERVQETVMQLPILTGCAGPGLPCFPTVPEHQSMWVPGDRFYHCGTSLATLALHYTAARRDEICNLDCDDIGEVDGIPVLHIRFSEGKRLKTDESERTLPIPDELLRLRFLEYVDRIRGFGFKKVFPDLFKPYSDTPPGNTLYDNVKTIIERSPDEFGGGLERYWPRLFHALRHGTNDELRRRGVSVEFRNELTGHAQVGTNSVVYSGLSPMESMRKLMRIVPVITSHIEASPLLLLPVVERRDMSLWRDPDKNWDGFVNPVWKPFYKG